ADYGHIKWIEDLVPRAMWIQQPIDYNWNALWEFLTGGGNVSSSMVFVDHNLEKRGQGPSSSNDPTN
nr:hypothetical protein [Tanacetum cinerariifolium]